MVVLMVGMTALSGCGGGGGSTDTGSTGGTEAEATGGDGGGGGELTLDSAPIKWTMQSIWVPSITLWRGDKYFVDLVNRLALGELFIEYNEGGALVTTSDEIFDAVRTGSLDMATDWPSYWEGRDTAFSLITSHPMLLTPGDYMIWYWQAGGLELAQQLYDEYNIVWYPHSVTSPESGQRTNVAIKELTDYSGLKLRQCGRTQALILEKLGASAVFLPGADIYLSVDRGVVDGAEFGVPETDWSMAFQEISQYLVVPGWHQPGPVSGVMINKDSYGKLPDHVKYVFKEAAMSSMMWAWTYFEYTSGIYQNNFAEAGIETSRLSDEALATIQQTAWDVLIEDATANPNHARIAFSQLHYMMTYKDWREIQSPLTHGRNPAGLDDTYAKMEQIARDHGVYEDVIAAAEGSLARAQGQVHWEPGTPYVQNPIAP
jgi:TRAP-type mannitol/chloroaromatic compound transport system substrate-binding protein